MEGSKLQVMQLMSALMKGRLQNKVLKKYGEVSIPYHYISGILHSGTIATLELLVSVTLSLP